MTTNIETFQFQAEARQVLDLMIHSLYTNKEIFLRELISNASDALDRLRIEALSNPDLLGPDDKLEIWIESDPQARTLTISDNGIGMSRDEVIANIGTIAKSGTRELLQTLREQRVNHSARLLPGAIPKRQAGQIYDVEKEFAARLKPFMEFVADFDCNRAAMAEHPQRIDEVKGLRRK